MPESFESENNSMLDSLAVGRAVNDYSTTNTYFTSSHDRAVSTSVPFTSLENRSKALPVTPPVPPPPGDPVILPVHAAPRHQKSDQDVEMLPAAEKPEDSARDCTDSDSKSPYSRSVRDVVLPLLMKNIRLRERVGKEDSSDVVRDVLQNVLTDEACHSITNQMLDVRRQLRETHTPPAASARNSALVLNGVSEPIPESPSKSSVAFFPPPPPQVNGVVRPSSEAFEDAPDISSPLKRRRIECTRNLPERSTDSLTPVPLSLNSTHVEISPRLPSHPVDRTSDQSGLPSSPPPRSHKNYSGPGSRGHSAPLDSLNTDIGHQNLSEGVVRSSTAPASSSYAPIAHVSCQSPSHSTSLPLSSSPILTSASPPHVSWNGISYSQNHHNDEDHLINHLDGKQPLPCHRVPGIWGFGLGLFQPGILEFTLEIDEETARKWHIHPYLEEQSETQLEKPDIQPQLEDKLAVQLLCLPFDLTIYPNNHLSNIPSDSHNRNKIWTAPHTWPSQGSLSIEVNHAEPCAKSWLPHDMEIGSGPLNITSAIQVGKNKIRCIQLLPLQHIFAIQASIVVETTSVEALQDDGEDCMSISAYSEQINHQTDHG
ncbi:hypothetical protein D9757_002516 [Collybiopsis confluens]|uniref:Uncharacterized protein n=1 Tax=Collybiopsis confluens TaxID=2823264 RepID=A0A8H5MEZ6_9AGAR|nr:hypothetical protein D9757_002516 [Collybiopsis confluens]